MFSAFVKALLSVMLLLVGNVAVKAQTESSDFTFEDGRCYSKWVINSRIGQFWANTTEMGFATFDENGAIKKARNDGKKTKLDYVPGLVAKGVIEAAQYYSQYPWAKPWFLSIADFGDKWYQKLPGGGTPSDTEGEGGGSLDDINGFKLYITLYELAKDGGAFADANIQSHAKTAINNAIKGLKDHNDKYSIQTGTLASDAAVGGWWHKKAYNNQMWLDGQYMGPALLAQIINYNNITNNVSDDDWGTIIKQLDIVWNQCWNSTDGLLYHAFEANGGTGTSSSHADLWEGLSSINFHSASYWGRACGWYFLALVDILHEMDKANLSSNSAHSTDYTRIKGYLTSLAAGLQKKQDNNTGGWYQILDKDNTFSASEYDNGQSHTQTYNYIESSATAIFAAAYLKAIRLGYLSEADYGETATNAYKCIVNNFFANDGSDGVNIFGSCRSAGLGSDKTDGTAIAGKENFRDGSNAYYLLGSDVTRVAKSKNETEGKVLGAFILAATEYERLHTTLVQDLPAATTINTALKVGLSGTESANETRSYKWYNTSDETTPVATTEEYTPEEAGTYKCVVEVTPKSNMRANNSYTITSSETVVGEANTTEPDNGATTTTYSIWFSSDSDCPNGITQVGNDFFGQTLEKKNNTFNKSGAKITIDGLGEYPVSYRTGTVTPTLTFKVPANSTGVFYILAQSSSGSSDRTLTLTKPDGTTDATQTVLGNNNVAKQAKYTGLTSGDYTLTLSNGVNIGCLCLAITSAGGSTEPTTYTIKYDLKGVAASNAPADATVNGAKIVLPDTNPTADGYNFIGWYTDEACTTVAIADATATAVNGIITLYAKWEPKSSKTTPTIEGATLDGTTLTVPALESTAAGNEQTVKVTLPKGATATVTSDGGDTFADGVLTYTAPAAGNSKDITLQVTAEDGTKDAYTIKIETKAKPGTLAEYTGTFTLEQMKGFGSASGNKTILSDDEALKLEAYSGTESGKEVQNTNDDNKGARVQYSASFKLTPNAEGVKIKKVTLYTKRTFSLTSNPLVTAEPDAKDNTIWKYTFNSIDDAITFTNSTTNKSNIEVLRINVVYEKGVADGKTALSAKFDKDVLSWYVNDEKPAEPTLTVDAAGAAFSDYTVKYTTSNTSVVTVDTDGNLTQVGSGTAVITAEVTPTDEDTYVGTSVVYTVTVKPLEVPTVYAHDITVYNTTGVQPQPVVDIYVTDANGNRVVLDKRYYELKYSVAKTEDNPNNIFVGTDGKFVLAGSAGDWTTGSAVVTVTCEPNAEAAKLYHITKANATFNVNVVETGGKLVPTFGGVKEAKMNAGSTREFVKAVLYGGVDITSGFTYNYEIATETGVTGSTVSATANNGTLSFKAGTLNDGVTEGKVTITITATPNTETEEQYTQAIGTIVVTVGKYKDFKSVKVSPNKLEKNVGDVIQDFTVEVIDENGNPVAEDDYTMVWGSSAPGIVAVVGDRSQGIFTAVSEGEAIIRVYVSNGEYAEMKGECKVNVKDAGKSAVDANTEYKIGTEFPADGLTLTLGGWMFNGSVDGLKGKYGTTDEVLANATAKWGKPSSENNKPVGFTHNITMTDQKNARQEYGSNCQPESNGIYDGVITEQPTKVIDPMFNVPCYGAYFALAPKTTGTVTVYVRQNGVFDTDNGKHRYRPQRRVFVMDEKGGHVSSTPNLEFPTGWRPTSEDMTKFDCDLLGGITNLTKFENGNHTQEETVNWIKSHFVGLKDFAMGKANFKNGVYASNLPTSVTHNQAQISRTDEQIAADPSVRGWSVLSVAPVSYTFDVKPGKTYYIYNYGSKLGLYGFVFRKGTPTVDEVSYSETEAPTVEKTAPNHVAKVSIDREFKGGIWNACVLPFSMNRQQIGKVFGPCYDKDNPEGTQILYFDRVENGKIHFVRHAYNTIVAGKPFLIKPKFDKAVISSENMGDYPYVTIEAIDAEKFGKDYKTADYYWTSSYGKFSIKPGDYFIRDAISNSNGKPVSGNVVRYPKTMTTDYAMNGFRGYLTAKTDDLRNSAKSFTIGISDFENNETTYIENVEIAEDGTLRQRLSGKVYNLQGQLVSDDASQLNSLPKGIYIVNGTKVSVK